MFASHFTTRTSQIRQLKWVASAHFMKGWILMNCCISSSIVNRVDVPPVFNYSFPLLLEKYQRSEVAQLSVVKKSLLIEGWRENE